MKRYYDFTGKSEEMNTHPVTLSYALVAGYVICSHWTKNTSVHLSLCRRQLFAVNKPIGKPQFNKYDGYLDQIKPDNTQYDVVGWSFYASICLSILLAISVMVTWTCIPNGTDFVSDEFLPTCIYLELIFGLWFKHIFLYWSNKSVTSNFLYRIHVQL